MNEDIDWHEEMPSIELLREYIAKAVSWPDMYGIDVPIKDGRPLLGKELDDWVDSHKHYSTANERARGIEVAAIGLAFMIKFAELELELTNCLEMDQ